jgi:cephalosporin-C deacetylase-like acetyl esterase
VPVGHSGKQFESYQIPAQVFAMCGYAALTFDPPGQAGEKKPGNDHFRDGVRCYMTGATSQRFFVMDALRAVDYLATRRDVDMRRGVGMTGVSGGGFTTLYASTTASGGGHPASRVPNWNTRCETATRPARRRCRSASIRVESTR